MIAKFGGVVMRVANALVYVPATAALKLAPMPQITRMPGAPEGLLGVALHEGEILPVVSIGPGRDSVLVCSHAGALLGIVGGRVEGTGIFEVDEDGSSVRWFGETASPLDLASVCAKLVTPSWGGSWTGSS
jgi:hypothetical protein